MHPFPRLRTALLAAMICVPGLAFAQGQATKIFIVDNSEGYGVDSCLASNGACGQAVANAWCRVNGYEQAVSYGRATSDAVVSTVAEQASVGSDQSVAVTCSN